MELHEIDESLGFSRSCVEFWLKCRIFVNSAEDQFYLARVGMSTLAKKNITAMYAELVDAPELFEKPHYWRARLPVFWVDPSMWPMHMVVQPR